ncbi:MAG TPA: aldo/keto reductase [Vicinamibacterales bacterium]|nr:aldo/keto reductase [Vicinamibacterales bacterium]
MAAADVQTASRPLLRRFGRTGLTFPEIGLGTWTLSDGPFGPITADDSREVVRAAVALGVTFFDTADIYGHGRVESLLGESLPERAGVFVATKVGNEAVAGGPSRKNFDVDYVAAAVESCRQRLRQPAIGLLQLHNPPAGVLEAGPLLEKLADLKRAGKIRAIGLSTTEASDLHRLDELGIFDAVQIPFNVLRQDLLLSARDALESWGGAVVVRTPLEFGLLSGRLPQPPALSDGDYRRRAWGREEEAQKRAAADALGSLCAAAPRSLPQLAIQVSLLPSFVSVVIPGCRDVEQLSANLAASRDVPPLGRRDLIEVDRVLRDHGLTSALATAFSPRTQVSCSDLTPNDGDAARTLAAPFRIGRLELANRIVRSGTTERAADRDGIPEAAMGDAYHRLVQGGTAMLITGYLAVEPAGRASLSHPILTGPPATAAWTAIVERCKAVSATKLCAQLGHGGALALSTYEPSGIERHFRDAALAAEAAGFDAVQLHAAHGYFLGQLLSSRPALRGGAAAHDGLSLFRRIVESVAAAIRPQLALLVKVNVSDFVAGGYDVSDAEVAAEALGTMPVDAVEWSGWTPAADPADTPSRLGEVNPGDEGFFVPFAARVKRLVPHLPMGTCGGFRSAVGMSRAISAHGLDFVSLSRAFIAEPDLPKRLLAGQPRAFCDGCNQCLAKHIRPVHCPRLT